MLPGPEEEAQTSDQVKRFLGLSVPVIPFSSSWLESAQFHFVVTPSYVCTNLMRF